MVLAIVGGLLALALPQFLRMYDRTRASLDRDDLERSLLALPLQVRLAGHGGYLWNAPDAAANQDGPQPASPVPPGAGFEQWQALKPQLPQGWTMQVPKPILFDFSGACSGGEVIFTYDSLSLRYTLAPPLCRPALEENRG